LADNRDNTREIGDMSDRLTTVLLIEDNPGDARLIRELLAEGGGARFQLECVDRLSTGLERLVEGGIDIVLLDLGLPDSQGLNTLHRVIAELPEVPITVVLTNTDDEELAVQAVRAGAQDYLIKGQIENNLLVRAMRYAMERYQLQVVLRSLALIDELTGLYNRRGFVSIGEQHLKLADRTKRGLALILVDLDHLNQINDTLGHQEGDRVLIETARILTDTFRRADVVARIGGDEFAALAIEVHTNSAESLTTRLQKNLDAFNAGENRPYKLSLRIGTSCYDPEDPCLIDELVERADRSMYEQEQEKQMRSSERGMRNKK
jgi:two-component system cell cycle response regulator